MDGEIIMKKIALVFAGGTGQRMGANIPKQFLKICGKEIIIKTLELFENNKSIDEIYVVCIKEWREYLENLIKKYSLIKVAKIVDGGVTGQDSIYNGLCAINSNYSDAFVIIHDGVRPLVSDTTINKCICCLEKNGSAVTVTPNFETPVISNDGIIVNEIIDRKKMYNAQAPQCFKLSDIMHCHKLERNSEKPYDGVVDSCSLMCKYGYKSALVEGNRGNVKVTTVEDLFSLISSYNYNDYKILIDLNNGKND